MPQHIETPRHIQDAIEASHVPMMQQDQFVVCLGVKKKKKKKNFNKLRPAKD